MERVDDWLEWILYGVWPDVSALPDRPQLKEERERSVSMALRDLRVRGATRADAEDIVQEIALKRWQWLLALVGRDEPLLGRLDREEVAQAVLQALMARGRGYVSHVSMFSPWSRFPDGRAVVSAERQRRGTSRSFVPIASIPDMAAPGELRPDVQLETKEKYSHLRQVASSLGPGTLALLDLTQLGLSFAASAQALGLAPATAGKGVRRMLQRLHAASSTSEQAVDWPVIRRHSPPDVFVEEGEPARGAPGGRVVEIWYGTNRVPAYGDATSGFTGELEGTGRFHYGRCRVFVPEGHCWGETRSPWWKRLLRLGRLSDELRLLSILPASGLAFVSELRKALDRRTDEARDILLFIHGYSVTFEQAAIRAAQLAVDLHASEATAFFSWPSRGTTRGYWADEESVRLSERPLERFLKRLVAETGARRVHVLAHSMGNRAFARIADALRKLPRPLVGEVLLAAPDVNTIEFRAQATGFKALASRTTLYASSGDRALRASKRMHDYPRAGLVPPVVVLDGIQSIDVSASDLSFMGHGYYSACEAVLYDMHEVLVAGLHPDRRARLATARDEAGNVYWRIRA